MATSILVHKFLNGTTMPKAVATYLNAEQIVAIWPYQGTTLAAKATVQMAKGALYWLRETPEQVMKQIMEVSSGHLLNR